MLNNVPIPSLPPSPQTDALHIGIHKPSVILARSSTLLTQHSVPEQCTDYTKQSFSEKLFYCGFMCAFVLDINFFNKETPMVKCFDVV